MKSTVKLSSNNVTSEIKYNLKGTVAKNQIESIKFERGKEPTDIDIMDYMN